MTRRRGCCRMYGYAAQAVCTECTASDKGIMVRATPPSGVAWAPAAHVASMIVCTTVWRTNKRQKSLCNKTHGAGIAARPTQTHAALCRRWAASRIHMGKMDGSARPPTTALRAHFFSSPEQATLATHFAHPLPSLPSSCPQALPKPTCCIGMFA